MNPRPLPSLPVLPLLLWLHLVVLWLTWTPTDVGPGSVLLSLVHYSPRSLIGNVALLAPIGVLLATAWAGRFDARGVILRSAAWCAGVSGFIEITQFGVPGRSPSPWDFVLNTGGGALAAGVTLGLMSTGFDRARLRLLAVGGVWIGVLIFLCATGSAGPSRMELAGWNPDHEVMAGDEWGGGRRYLGEVRDALVCAGPADQEVCAAPGAEAVQRARVRRNAENSQQVRVAAFVRSDAPQPGLSRIVTFSMGPWDRNVTLAQEGRDLILRVRTPATGPNGSEVPLVLPDAVPDGVPLRVEARYGEGRIEMEVSVEDGTHRRGTFAWGFFSGWWFVNGPRIAPGSIPRAALVAAAGFSLPLGFAVALLGSLPLWVRVAGGAVAAPTLAALLALPLGIPFPPVEAWMATGFGGMGGWLSAWRRGAGSEETPGPRGPLTGRVGAGPIG